MKKPRADLPSQQLNCPITVMEKRVFVCCRHVGAGKADGGESVWERQKVKQTNGSVDTKAHKSTHIVNLLRCVQQAGLNNAAEALE